MGKLYPLLRKSIINLKPLFSLRLLYCPILFILLSFNSLENIDKKYSQSAQFNKMITLANPIDSQNKFAEASKILLGLSELSRIELYRALQGFCYSKKDFTKAIEHGKLLLECNKSKIITYNSIDSYMSFTKSYFKVSEKKLFNNYFVFTRLYGSVSAIEGSSIGAPGQALINESHSHWKDVIVKIVIIAFVAKFLIALFLLYLRKKHRKARALKFARMMERIQNHQKIHALTSSEVQTGISSYQDDIKLAKPIADETYNTILKKLIKFEDNCKFLKKDINLAWLSNHLGTNTKYLSEIIKNRREKSFNSYINGLRIAYITNKLYEDPVYREYKITYLAEECGYASPQVFVKAFKKETGVTPSYFIEQLKMEIVGQVV